MPDGPNPKPSASVTVAEGYPTWDAAVDAVMERFHVPEAYAQRVVSTVLEAVTDD